MAKPQDPDFSKPRRPPLGVSPGFVFSTTLLWAAAAVATWWFTGRCVVLFKDFGAKMPYPTVCWIQFHKPLAVACGLVALGLVVKEFLPIPWRTRATLNISAAAVWLVWLAAMALTLGVPFLTVMESLMGGGSSTGGGAGAP